jgi:hypothetical protein
MKYAQPMNRKLLAGFAILAVAAIGAAGGASADSLVSLFSKAEVEHIATNEILKTYPMPGDPADADASFNELFTKLTEGVVYRVDPPPSAPPSGVPNLTSMLTGDPRDSHGIQ